MGIMEEQKYYLVDVPDWWTTDDASNLWWRNFEKHCHDIYIYDLEFNLETGDQTTGTIRRLHKIFDEELKRYGGKYKHRNTRSSIRFKDESEYTMFLLRWA
jgi:hypothetical protein